jgi:hypothetical protein
MHAELLSAECDNFYFFVKWPNKICTYASLQGGKGSELAII